jgi:hypothetical protein
MTYDNSRAFANYDSRFDPPDDDYDDSGDENADDMIHSFSEFYAHICADSPESAKRNVYKYTDCGAWINFGMDSITVGSIVEGSDVGTETHTLNFPFTGKEYNDAIQAIEDEASAIWEWANNEEHDGEPYPC